MKSVNQVSLLGNLTRDPELRYTPTGTPVINFSIATNRSYKEGDEWKETADFHNVVFWNKPAEIISQFVSKGNKLYIQGRLQTRKWEDKEGNKKYTTEVIGRDFVLLTPKKKDSAEIAPTEESELAPAEEEKVIESADSAIPDEDAPLVNTAGEKAPF